MLQMFRWWHEMTAEDHVEIMSKLTNWTTETSAARAEPGLVALRSLCLLLVGQDL